MRGLQEDRDKSKGKTNRQIRLNKSEISRSVEQTQQRRKNGEAWNQASLDCQTVYCLLIMTELNSGDRKKREN